MNKIYNIVWSQIHQAWVVTSESATRHGKPSTTRRVVGAALVAGLLTTSMQLQADTPLPNTLPTGGSVVAGQATISQSGSTMNINQTTGKAAVNWNTFSIGADAMVNITQPGASSVLLNRVIGSDPSQIYGRLNANGQVFLLNPNGVLFGRGARVDVGGLVATTLNMRDEDFLSGNYRFFGNGSGSVINQGELLGKYVALLAPEVRNEGVIVARQGTVALAGSTGATLNLVNNQLIDIVVDKADIDTLVENKHLIQAEEGTVILAAQSANHLLGKVVNSGSIEAKGMTTDGGKVRLTASSNIEHSGSINVDAGTNGKGGSAVLIANLDNPDSRTDISGSISARGGSESGDGGFVETSASHLKIASSTRVDTRAPHGKTGLWLLDPTDFTVAASGGDITGADLGNALNMSSVTIDTNGGSCAGVTCPGGAGTNGDIIINDTVTWGVANNLILKAYRDIVFDTGSDITNTAGFGAPAGGEIHIEYGLGTSGKAVIKQGASRGGIVVPDIVDDTHGGAVTSSSTVNNTARDFWVGTNGIDIYVGLAATTGVYGDDPGANFYASLGGTQINISTPDTAATWSTDPATAHAGATPSITYTGGFTSSHYSSFVADNAVTYTVTQRPLTVSLSNSAAQKTKTYNGTNAEPVGFTPTYTINGFATGDTAATLSNTGTTYTGSMHAGAANSRTLTVAGLALTGISGGNGLLSDYTLSGVTSVAASATINPIQLTATLTNTGTTKVYDGSDSDPVGFTPTYSLNVAPLGTDTVNLTGTFLFDGKHVLGTNNIGATDLSIASITGSSHGSLSTDYALTSTIVSKPATITAIPLTLSATLGASGTTAKVYDGTKDAPAGFTPGYSLTGTLRTGDTVNLTGTAKYDSKDVVGATKIDVTGVHIASIAGNVGNQSEATDYSLTGTTASFSGATITKADLNTPYTGTKTDDGKDTISGSQIKANGVTVNNVTEYFNFTGDGLLPDTLVNINSEKTDKLSDASGLTLDSANGKNGALASNYNLPVSLLPADFEITVNAQAKLTAVDIIKRTIEGNLEKAKRGTDTTTTDFWKKINQAQGATQSENDTVTQSVQKVLQKLCGSNCAVDEAEVAKYLGGLNGCSTGFVLSGGSCTPEKGELTDKDLFSPNAGGPGAQDITVKRQKRIAAIVESAGGDSVAIVKKLYLAITGKEPDSEASADWSAQLNAGSLSPEQVALNIMDMNGGGVNNTVIGRSVSDTNKTIKSVVKYFEDDGADNAKLAQYVNRANNVGGAGSTPVTDEDVNWVTNYVNEQNRKKIVAQARSENRPPDWEKRIPDIVTTKEVSVWLKGGQVKPSPSASPSAEPSLGGDTPPAGGDTPPAGGDTPPTGGDTPPAGEDTPPTGEDTPPAGGDTPPAGGDTPPAGGDTPPVGGDTPPVGGGTTPVGGGTTPVGGGTTPAGGTPQNQGDYAEDFGIQVQLDDTKNHPIQFDSGDIPPVGGTPQNQGDSVDRVRIRRAP